MRWRWRRRRRRRDVVWPTVDEDAVSPTEVLLEELPTEPLRAWWMDAPTEDPLAFRVPPYVLEVDGDGGRHRLRP